MATMTRQDVHRPSAMDPADYVWIGEADDHHEHGSFDFDYERYFELTNRAPRFDERGRVWGEVEDIAWASVEHAAGGRGGCDHCGQTNIRYWMFYLHLPTSEVVAVGGTCAGKLSLSSREDIARRAQLERRRLDEKLMAWRGESAENERAYAELLRQEDEAGGSGANEFVDSLLRYGRRNGFLSEAQRDAVLKGIETRARRAAEAEAKAEKMGDPEPAAVIEATGRIEVTGRLLATKSQDGYYGSELKMLVLDDRGFKLWGTMPGVLVDQAFELAREAGLSGGGVAGALREGLKVRVSFTAAIERSRKDETFGFFKRPTKAKVI